MVVGKGSAIRDLQDQVTKGRDYPTHFQNHSIVISLHMNHSVNIQDHFTPMRFCRFVLKRTEKQDEENHDHGEMLAASLGSIRGKQIPLERRVE